MKNLNIMIENFGKIKKANIKMSNMMLFVGDNNSGKSYLMHLIYGLLNNDIRKYIQIKDIENSPNFINIKEKLTKDLLEDGKIISLEEIYEDIIKVFNIAINNNKEKFIFDLFNEKINIDKLEISVNISEKIKNIKIYKSKMPVLIDNNIDLELIYIEFEDGFIREIPIFKDKGKIGDRTIFHFIPTIINITIQNKSIYLPISRTGLMLTYKTLISKSLEDYFSNKENEEKVSLTKPNIDFLRKIAALNIYNKGKYCKQSEFLEKYILKGYIEIEEDINNSYYFKSKDINKNLPLHICSGVVTEVAPLYVILKYVRDLGILLIEEPEMCLHTKLQIELARCLIKLYNNGLPVIITTHSDIIPQHINNMYKLGIHKDKLNLMNKYNYEEDDIVNIDDISIYQFDTSGGITKIEKLSYYESSGFLPSTFRNALKDIYEQGMDFSYEEDDE